MPATDGKRRAAAVATVFRALRGVRREKRVIRSHERRVFSVSAGERGHASGSPRRRRGSAARGVAFRAHREDRGARRALPGRFATDYFWSRLNVPTPVYLSQVEIGSVCPTPFFDQSHTPCGKIERSRATSAGVNVTA